MTDLVRQLLEKRGVVGEEAQKKFITPDWEKDTYDPFLMKDMDKALERIQKAIQNKEKIVIYHDYDCDGIPGGVVLYDFFTSIGYANFETYVPHRHNEGYGIHMHALERFVGNGVTLMITVDLGITNVKEIAFAQENGIDVILTDHHLPIEDGAKQIIPPAFAVINTKQNDCSYPEKMLCGCATAWKLAHAFLVKYRQHYGVPVGYEKWWLDMVGISTIADMVPLVGENRILAIYGLKVLSKTKRQGLLRLLKNAKVTTRTISEMDIAFSIAPRLNAAGRMNDPAEAFKALLQNDESVFYADQLEKYNKQRKSETGDAHMSVDFSSLSDNEVVVIGDEKWGPGILGLIATRIVEKTNKTTFVWGMGEDKDIMKGSARAGIDGANIVNLMNSCADVFSQFGGHEEAGGFAVHKKNLKKMEKGLQEAYEHHRPHFKQKSIALEVDFVLDPTEITTKLYREIQSLAPFGVANKAPTIKVSAKDKKMIEFGDKRQHIEIAVEGLSFIQFNVDEDKKKILESQDTFIGNIEWDPFKKKVRMRLL